jgi:Holliday junction resolvasome RuvABC endonuclease subunit
MGGNMKILALDQSTKVAAYAVMKDGKLLDYGIIQTKSSTAKSVKETIITEELHLITIKMPEEEYNTTLLRISYICDEVKKLIKKVKPNRVAFEEIYMQQKYNPYTKKKDYTATNISGFRSSSRCQGQLSRILWEMKIPYDIILETTWITAFGKYSSSIKREERKADVMAKVNEMYGLDITVDDISDAIGIAYYVSQSKID